MSQPYSKQAHSWKIHRFPIASAVTPQNGSIGYVVPHSIYPPGYHCNPSQPLPFAGLASQKNHMAIYLMSIYGDADQLARFNEAWAKTGKKLDMGKSCIRFKKLDDVPLKVIAQAIKRGTVKKLIAMYDAVVSARRPGKAKVKSNKSTPTTAKKKAVRKATRKRVKKASGKKTAAKR